MKELVYRPLEGSLPTVSGMYIVQFATAQQQQLIYYDVATDSWHESEAKNAVYRTPSFAAVSKLSELLFIDKQMKDVHTLD